MSQTDVAAAGPVCAGPAVAGNRDLGAGQVVAAATAPYPWPWDGRFAARRCALLVITDGAPIGDASVAGVVAALTARAAESGVLTVRVVTGRPPRGARPAVLPGPDAGWAFGPTVTAAGWDGFYGSPLDDLLRTAGRSQLLLAGRLLETGVHSTLRGANDRGYECLTLGDACEAGAAETGRGALSSITMSGGIFGAIGTLADVLGLLDALPGSTGTTGT